jgi:hypothetical protein
MFNKDIYYVKKRIKFLENYKNTQYSNNEHITELLILKIELENYSKKIKLLKKQKNTL